MGNGPIPALTGIRGVAALWVLVYHSQILAVKMNPAVLGHEPYFLRAGWTGVDLFFALSGFILMHAHHGQFRRLAAEQVRSFAVARFLRVFPPNLIALLLVALLVAVDRSFATWFAGLNSDNLSLRAFVKSVFIATRWGLPGRGDWNEPIWSLSVEVVGYVLFPLLAMAALHVRSFWLAIAGAVLSLAIVIVPQLLLHHLGQNIINVKWSILRLLAFFPAGMMLRRAADFAPPYVRQSAPMLAIACVVALPLLAIHPAGSGLMPIAFAFLIFALYFRAGIISAALQSPLAMFLGKISFPVYLLHLMPLLALNHHLAAAGVDRSTYLAWYVVYLAALISAAWIMHRYVERALFRRVHRRGRVTVRPDASAKPVEAVEISPSR